MKEWFFHSYLKSNGLLHLDYKFYEVEINNENKGVFAFESHFKNELLKFNNVPIGPILGFDETNLWTKSKFDSLDYQQRDDSIMLSAKIKIYNQEWCKSHEGIKIQAVKKLKLLQLGKSKLNTLVDIEKWSKYIAASELFGSFHNLRWHNLKIYYNLRFGRI